MSDSGRPRRTRRSVNRGTPTSTPTAAPTPTPNPYKKPTYLANREVKEPEVVATPTSSRGRGRGRGRPSTGRGRGRGATRSNARPECVATRTDATGPGRKRGGKKKKRGGYNTNDYHYGSDFDSELEESEIEAAQSDSDRSDDDNVTMEDPIESDSDESLNSSRLVRLPSPPVPFWLDAEKQKEIEELEIPQSSDDLLLQRDLVVKAVAVYEPLRRFNQYVRLTPFRFEDFCACLASEEQSPLLAEIHIQLLKTILREEDANGTVFGPNECKDSIQATLFFMDNMAWPESLRSFMESDPSWAELHKEYSSVEYPFCGPDIRIKVLLWLVDVFIQTNMVRESLGSDGNIRHEDHCRSCNRLGELICCEQCPAVYHLQCIEPPISGDDPPDDWKCPICVKHKLPGVIDCQSELEKAGLLIRHEKLGYDRHGRKYWFLVRRILVESEDGDEVWYYSTPLQVEELLHRLDVYESELVEAIRIAKDEIFRQMEVTEKVTNSINTNHRKTYLDAENAFLKRIHEERELIRKSEEEDRVRIEEEEAEKKRVEEDEKNRVDNEVKRKEDAEKKKIREERLARRNRNKFQYYDEDISMLLKETEDGQVTEDDDKSGILKVDGIENEVKIENGKNFESQDTEKLEMGDSMNDSDSQSTQLLDEIKEEAKDESTVVKEEKPPEKSSIRKSKALYLEVDSEERMTRLKSTGLYKLGQEGGFRNYVNNYTCDTLALSKAQHNEDRDRRRHMSHKFSLTTASECKWSGSQHGFRATLVGTLRTTLLNFESGIPSTLLHVNWPLLRKAWVSAVTACISPRDFSKALTALSACLRPAIYNPVWSEGIGHVKLVRTTVLDREEKKKAEKRDKKDRDDEEDRLRLLPQCVKYSIPPKHQVWKQKGEEYRIHARWGWIWLSTLRPAKPRDARKQGLLNGPSKHVIQVKSETGKVKTMLIDPNVFDKLMAKRSATMKKTDMSPTATPVKGKEDDKRDEPMELDEDIKIKEEEKIEIDQQDTKDVESPDDIDLEIQKSVKESVESVIQQIEKAELKTKNDLEIKQEPEGEIDIKKESEEPECVDDKPCEGDKGEKPEDLKNVSLSRNRYRNELINVSLGIVSANRILYPKIAHKIPFLDSLLARRLKWLNIEEKELTTEFGGESMEMVKNPPKEQKIEEDYQIKLDDNFPLAGIYSHKCYSYSCQVEAAAKAKNFECRCYSPICRLKFVIEQNQKKKIEKVKNAEKERLDRIRNEIEKKRCYTKGSSSEKLYLKKLPEQQKKKRNQVKYPLTSTFRSVTLKKPSILVMPPFELKKLARLGGRTMLPIGFTTNPKWGSWAWAYPCGRPLFKTGWQFRTVHISSLASAAMQLRTLYACVRWDDMQTKAPNQEGKNQITTDMEIITSEILNHRIIGRFMEKVQYLRKKQVVPIDAPKITSRVYSEVTPSRSGLRKRKRAESPDKSDPVVTEEWVDEEKVDLWEIRFYGERIEKKPERKDNTPNTRTKSGVSLHRPEKYDPSPTTAPTTVSPSKTADLMREQLETEMKMQRAVHLSKRDNHVKNNNANTVAKPPTPTASQQLLQQNAAAGLPANPRSYASIGKKFFLTKQGGAIVTSPNTVSESSTQSPGTNPVLLNRKPGTPLPITTKSNNTTPVAQIPQQQQKLQVFRTPDGKLQIRGLLPGQHAYQTSDGKIHVLTAPAGKILTQTGQPNQIVLGQSPGTPTIIAPSPSGGSPVVVTSGAITIPQIPMQMNNLAKTPLSTPTSLSPAPLITYSTPKGGKKPAVGQGKIIVGTNLNVSQPSSMNDQISTVALVTSGMASQSPLVFTTAAKGSMIQTTASNIVNVSQAGGQQFIISQSPTMATGVNLNVGGHTLGQGRVVLNEGQKTIVLNSSCLTQQQLATITAQLQSKKGQLILQQKPGGGAVAQFVQSPGTNTMQLFQQQGQGMQIIQATQSGSPQQQIMIGGIPYAASTVGNQQILLKKGGIGDKVTTGIPLSSAIPINQASLAGPSNSQEIQRSPGTGIMTPNKMIKLEPANTLKPAMLSSAGTKSANLPISIVSPSKPTTTMPSPIANSGKVQVQVKAGQQIQVNQGGTQSNVQTGGMNMIGNSLTNNISQPGIVQNQLRALAPNSPRVVTPTTAPGQIRPGGLRPNNKIVAQIYQTPAGPKVVIQGISPSELTQTQMAQLQSQIQNQLSLKSNNPITIQQAPIQPATSLPSPQPPIQVQAKVEEVANKLPIPQKQYTPPKAKSPKKPPVIKKTSPLPSITASIEAVASATPESSLPESAILKNILAKGEEKKENEIKLKEVKADEIMEKSSGEISQFTKDLHSPKDKPKAAIPKSPKAPVQIQSPTLTLASAVAAASSPPSQPQPGSSKGGKRKTTKNETATSPSKVPLQMTQHKLSSSLFKHKELLKKDIFKKRGLLEKELHIDIQKELSEEMGKKGHQPGNAKIDIIPEQPKGQKRKFNVSKSPSDGGKGGKKKKKGNKLYCICQTAYDNSKFYVGCDVCSNWFHGECIGITEKMSSCLSEYVCDSCQREANKVYCLCKQPYDESQFYICCDTCQDWFHGRCVGILQSEASAIDEYVCPNCDSNTPLNHANLRPLSFEDYPHLSKLVKQIQAHKSSWPFLEAVDPTEAPNYYKVIKEPMDLQQVEFRIEQKCYSRLRDFIGDIQKIFDNCRYYNPIESPFYKSAESLETFFAQKITLLRQRLA